MKARSWIGLMLAVLAWGALGRAGCAQDNRIVIGETLKLRSAVLDEDRTLQISLPDRYQNSRERYPVVYVLDGEGQFAQAVGAVRFLGKVNKMAQAIVVGIPNTDRNRDLSPPTANPEDLKKLPGGGGAERFLAFLTDELGPYIDAHYRTWPFRILFGHSGAGLFVIHTFLVRPAAFGAYIASSPALFWNDNGETRSAERILAAEPARRGVLFLSRGQETELMARNLAPFVKVLQDRAPRGLRWKFEIFAEENHESSPHRAIFDGLEFIYQGWSFNFSFLYEESDPKKTAFTAGVLVDHYRGLTAAFGYDCRPAESYYNGVGYDLLRYDLARQNSVAPAIELFKANVLFYPESSNAYDSLAEGYMAAGDKDRAIENYEKSLALNPKNTNAVERLKKLKG
ncbi:MAG: tetratricopeptide repeat protein [Candidatus Aminicenantes bacterium]|nr:MAG: tetratricopeptide repeat protein [Candidatus Aminicenantes bacterium]